jgi:hypothetical protein
MAIEMSDVNYVLHKVGGHNVVFNPSDYVADGVYKYYGFLSATGTWCIQRIKTDLTETRYCFGRSGYAAAWVAYNAQSYEVYNDALTTVST